ncbi:MAG: glutamine--fructose-6-phosphate transaminase (isomerizing) [Rhodobacteraceae bacterium]|nr:glutamine--fructose-6-phosphate transaminase (isomerizing) [Paracoccaceae bacterium]
MCGIVGVLGAHEAAPLLVEALKRLEYRGYDSAGIATISKGRLDRRRAVGKLVELSDLLVHEPLAGRAGIGHTRWATHGAATRTNAHPHKAGPVAVVHNGIIENYRALREEIADAGLRWDSETDTETIALICQKYLAEGMTPVDAAQATVKRLEGAFALAFLFDGEPDLIFAARRGSPLAIGYGEGEMYLGSDAIALGQLTDRITYLEDGDTVVIRRAGAEIFDASGAPASRAVKSVHTENTRIDKGGYRHFMAKEIAEQPAVIRATLDAYLDDTGSKIALPAPLDLTGTQRVTMVACGTAYYACLTAKYWIEALARIPVDVDIASEFRYREPPLPEGTLTIFVSQSGETADTLAALRYCESQDKRIVSLTNVAESSIARASDVALPIHAGPEIGVASTKAFTCQLAALAVLALHAGQQTGRLDAGSVSEHLGYLSALPGLINQALGLSDRIAQIATELAEAQDILYLGRGAMFPMALEAALKMKEISYIHAEGYASGELKHGPIALVDRTVPVVVFAPHDRLFGKTLSNMEEVIARQGQVVLVTDAEGAGQAGDGAAHQLVMPSAAAVFAPLLYAVPAQLLAYHTAVARGTDVDQPRNLAKSVTVE